LALFPPGRGEEKRPSWSVILLLSVFKALKCYEAEYLEEIEGIAAGVQAAGFNYDALDIITQNGYFELSNYYLPSIG
jgi:hypothetical protein